MIYKKRWRQKPDESNDLYRRIETTKHLDRFFVTGLEDLRIRMKDLRIRMKDLRIRMKYYEGQ